MARPFVASRSRPRRADPFAHSIASACVLRQLDEKDGANTRTLAVFAACIGHLGPYVLGRSQPAGWRTAQPSGLARSRSPRTGGRRGAARPPNPRNGENEPKAAQTLPVLRTTSLRREFIEIAYRRERTQSCANFADFAADASVDPPGREGESAVVSGARKTPRFRRSWPDGKVSAPKPMLFGAEVSVVASALNPVDR